MSEPFDLAEQLNAAQRPHAFIDSGLGQRLRDRTVAVEEMEWVSTCRVCGDYEDRAIHAGTPEAQA